MRKQFFAVVSLLSLSVCIVGAHLYAGSKVYEPGKKEDIVKSHDFKYGVSYSPEFKAFSLDYVNDAQELVVPVVYHEPIEKHYALTDGYTPVVLMKDRAPPKTSV